MDMKAEKSKMERLLKSLFGDDINVEEEMERYHEKRKKEQESACQESEEIMRKAHKTYKDIPVAVYEDVASRALRKELERYNTAKKMSQFDIEKRFSEEEMRDVSCGIQNAYYIYSRLCKDNSMTSTLTQEKQEELSEALAEAKKYYDRKSVPDSNAARLFAYSIFYYEIRRFVKKETKTELDAARVVAANRLRNIIPEICKTYNVLAAEKRIMDIEQYNHYKKMDEKYNIPEIIMRANTPADAFENMEIFEKAAKEIDQVLNQTEKVYGYKLNYIRSGNIRYDVWRWRYSDEEPEADPPVCTMWAEEIGTYDTPEEAKQAAVPAEDGTPAEIQEYDPEEMWAIVDTEGKNVTDMLYPSKIRAAIFLLGVLGKEKAPGWHAWEQFLDKKEREKKQK